MSTEAQRVVVIHDASKDFSLSGIRWVLDGLSLKHGDQITFLGILHPFNNASVFSVMGAGKLFRSTVDSNSLLGAKHRTNVVHEVSRKLEENRTNAEIIKISQQFRMEKIVLEVSAASSRKLVALTAAQSLKATWVVLDRQMKKDKKYFMDRLSCGISRVKRNNTIEKLRGPKETENNKLPTDRSSKVLVTYDEMLPGDEKFKLSKKRSPSPQKTRLGKGQEFDGGESPCHNSRKSTSLFRSSSSEQLNTPTISSPSWGNIEASSSSLTDAKSFQSPFQEQENTTDRKASPDEQQYQNISNNNDQKGGCKTEEEFENSTCSFCNNRRPKIGWKRDFTYAELQSATNGFALRNFLSEGGFGTVYRGEMNGLKIAVKQHKNASFQGEKEFKSEVHVLGKARHENVVMLLGSCSEGSHRLLVYEYVCFGSLDQHLSKHAKKSLSWEMRIKIALGAAKGLQYLHENNIIHRDMRPNNILVTHDYEALLGDFGLAKTQQDDTEHSSDTRVVGSLGYMAPEYAEFGKVSTKTDVYSFGVILLQLITGLRTTDKKLGGKSLVGWARPLLKERNYPDLIDDRIIDSHDVHQLWWMGRVAEKCLCKDPHKRLKMDEVVNALENLIKGNTICGIRDFSPAQSDSGASSMSDSSESQWEEESFSTETTSFSSMSQISGRVSVSPPKQVVPPNRFSTLTVYGKSSTSGMNYETSKEQISGRVSVSPPKQVVSPYRLSKVAVNGQSPISGIHHQTKKETSQKRNNVFYDEMVD